jgi:hypothetical protein
LFDPDTNIAIILREAKRHQDFASATALEAAVDAFVIKAAGIKRMTAHG